jgi:hypothetical protein
MMRSQYLGLVERMVLFCRPIPSRRPGALWPELLRDFFRKAGVLQE